MFSLRKLFGGPRIIKTGVAVFLTALICEMIGWPPVFAVITAIVTIEPTVSDSIKKSFVRFPASAIGSAYAVIFITFFGNSPLTYTLAAVFTIATCYKLNLHAGLLVATLTSVAMIEVIHDHFFIAFLIRLGTTTIGLVISTIVNMFVIPPDYRDEISQNVEKITKLTGNTINKMYNNFLEQQPKQQTKSIAKLNRLETKIKLTYRLIQFQKDEAKYQPIVASETALFKTLINQAETLQNIHDKLENIVHYPVKDLNWDEEKKEVIRNAVRELSESLQDASKFDKETHLQNKQQIMQYFRENDIGEIDHQTTHLPVGVVLLYELLALYDLVAQFHGSDE